MSFERFGYSEKPAPIYEWLGRAVVDTRRKRSRSHSDDAYLVNDQFGIFGVFDGAGSYEASFDAAHIASHVCNDTAEFTRDIFRNKPVFEMELRLKDLFRRADDEINSALFRKREMGITTALIAIPFERNDGKRCVAVGYVGDSRGYIVRADGTLMWLTRDFPDLSEQDERWVRSVSTREELNSGDPALRYLFHHRSELESAIGRLASADDVYREPAIKIFVIPEGATHMLLCTDGITDNLIESEVASIITHGGSATDLIEKATERAMDLGSIRRKDDDMTAVIIPFKN